MVVLTTKRPWPNELSLKKHFIKIVQKSVAFSVLELSIDELSTVIQNSTSKRISDKRVASLADKLTELAKQSYCAIKKTSPMLEEVRYYPQ